MPEFILNAAGSVHVTDVDTATGTERGAIVAFRDLDEFTQGYVEALFFTSEAPGVSTEQWQAIDQHDEGSIPGDVGFYDLAPETLSAIMADCLKFQDSAAWKDWIIAREIGEQWRGGRTDTQAGRDFWYTRNGHGCGFWDGDWPTPHDDSLTELSKEFGEVDCYLGDDDKVYLS